MTITFTHRGSFAKTEKFLKALKNPNSFVVRVLQQEAQRGVEALIKATPRDSGIAASSWGYKIRQNGRRVTIDWINTNVEEGFKVAVAIQYGYSTGTGGYVKGRDFINPAMKPVFDSISNNVWKAVKAA